MWREKIVMNDLSDVKAIIFDMDGVLFLSSGCHEKAYLEVLQPLGVTDFLYARDGAGRRTDEALRSVFARNGRELSEAVLEQLVKDKQARVRRMLAETGQVGTHSDEVIPQLGQKFRLAVATSGSRGTVAIYLNKAVYNENVFEFIIDGASVEKAKPEPDIYLLALDKLGLLPHECIIIEDAVNGVTAGVRAGMKVIAVTGTEEAQALLDAGATTVVDDLKEVSRILVGNV